MKSTRRFAALWILLVVAAGVLGAAAARAAVVPSDKDHVRSLDGAWRFKLEQAGGDYHGKGEKPLVPPNYPKEFEPFYRDDYVEADGWHDLKVPGNWEMAGFSPATYNQPDNASGFYRLSFDVPENWSGRIVKINFDGVQNGAEIWLNGQPVQVDEPSWGRMNYHEGGWTAFQADLTPQVKFGQTNLLGVRVMKNTRSVDLDTGDYFFLGGIHRTVTLFSVPKVYIDDLTVRTALRNEKTQMRQAMVTVKLKLAGGAEPTEIRAELEGQKPARGVSGADGAVTLQWLVSNPELWSAENPRLYNLSVSIDGERITRRIGIREVSIRDSVLLLNGVPIKLAGMCRHDVSPRDGTAVGPDVWRRDIELMKAANVNAIRTSHYPYGSGFYDLCDELGMYVIDELPYCWTPTDDPQMAPAFLQRARETVRRDKNHPSVIAWTIGNENKQGRNLQAVADLIRQLDDTRPRAVSCFAASKYKTELSDSHYTIPEKIQQSAADARADGHPHIYLENPNDWDVRLGADPGCWDAWGIILQRCWDVVAREDSLPGTFLWEWQDRAVADASPVKMYSYFPETGIHLLKIKGIVDGFRNPRPWYYDVKMIYSPIQVGQTLRRAGGAASFDVENRYSFTDLKKLKTAWTLLAGGKSLAGGEVHATLAPRTKGSIALKLPAQAAEADALRVDFSNVGGTNIISHQFALKPPAAPAMCKDLPRGLTFPQLNLITRSTKSHKGFWRSVTRFPATVTHIRRDPSAGDNLLAQGRTLDGDIIMQNDPQTILGRVHAEFADNRFGYRIEWSGPKSDLQEVGWNFAMPKQFDRFSWRRQARWTVYPEGHIARPIGTATPDSADVSLTKLTRPDAFDFNSTKYDCDCASLTDAAGRGLLVRFDPDQRHQCRAGGSTGAGAGGGYVLTDNRHVNPPADISTKIIRDLSLPLNPGDVIEGHFEIGSAAGVSSAAGAGAGVKN
jgi:beta-galactosidase/beta-glucuronidase